MQSQGDDEDLPVRMDAIRIWEAEAAMRMRMLDEEWYELDIEERARKIVLIKYREWIAEIEDRKKGAKPPSLVGSSNVPNKNLL